MSHQSEVEIVYLTEERVHARLVSLGAHFSLVKYLEAGTVYEVYVANDEIEFSREEDIG